MCAKLFHVALRFNLLVEHMGLNLVDRRNNLHIACKVNEVVGIEIAYADCANFTLFICSFQCSVCPVTVAEWLVEEHKVDVVGAEFAQTLINGCLGFVEAIVGDPYF